MFHITICNTRLAAIEDETRRLVAEFGFARDGYIQMTFLADTTGVGRPIYFQRLKRIDKDDPYNKPKKTPSNENTRPEGLREAKPDGSST